MPPIKNSQLGDRLRKARQHKQLSLRQLSEVSGVDHSQIARMERGEFAAPGADKLQRLATALAIDISDLYALAGYTVPDRLPDFVPYLRAKFDLPDQALSQLEEYFDHLRAKYPPKEGGRRGKKRTR